jgi:hypothetical protein
MKRSLILLTALATAGCASVDHLQNRVTTTLACDRAFVASLYGPIGITSEIDKRDLAEMPCAARDKAALPTPVAKP